MTTAQVVEMSVTVNNNSPIHLDDQTQPTFEMTPGFKPFTERLCQQGALLTGCTIMFLSKSYRLWLHTLNDLIESHKKCNAITSCKTRKVTVVSFERHISSESEAMSL